MIGDGIYRMDALVVLERRDNVEAQAHDRGVLGLLWMMTGQPIGTMGVA